MQTQDLDHWAMRTCTWSLAQPGACSLRAIIAGSVTTTDDNGPETVAFRSIRVDEAVGVFLIAATAAFVVLILVPTALQGGVLVAGSVSALAAGWRAFRLSIEADGTHVVVKNYFRTHRLFWSDVEEIRPCAVTMIGIPRRALGFQLRSGRLIEAQVTGGPLRYRARALAILAPLAAGEGVGISTELHREMTQR